MIVREAIYHRPKLNWSFAVDSRHVAVRLRTKRDNVASVTLHWRDKYAWEQSLGATEMEKFASDALFDYWEATVEPPFRRLAYYFELRAEKERVWFTEGGCFDRLPERPQHFEYPFIHPADVFAPPEWVKEAVFYQIFPERFADGDPSNNPENTQPWGGKPEWHSFFGGDLQGVLDHLDHLSELGVNAIYFTPIFEAPTNHKYDTRDYFKIDPHFGTKETLKRLVAECHKRGIRVILDAVFNHCGKTFPPFEDVLARGADSPYADWFHVREWPPGVKEGMPTYDTFAFVPEMPKLNTGNPDVRNYLLEVARYWIKEADIDGWRLDVANEIDHSFWREFRRVVKAAKPDAYILGEIWHDAQPWLQGDQFDAVMNYPFTNAVLDFVARGALDGKGFADALGGLLASHARPVTEAAFNLLDSHDTARLLTVCGNDKRKMKLAVVIQFTFPGVPCIYYGDEIGMDGEGDPDCRKCMVWDEHAQDRELFRFYQRIIRLRREHAALRTGRLRFVRAREGDGLVAYERVAEDGERFLIVLNNGDAPRSLALETEHEQWEDAFAGTIRRTADGKLRLELEPYGFQLLRKTNGPE